MVYLLNYDFSLCMNCTDVEAVWCNLQSIINNAISQFAPLVKLKGKQELSKVVQFYHKASYSPCPLVQEEGQA